MRQMTLLFGTMMAALALAGGTALALTAMQCGNGECLGTDGTTRCVAATGTTC